MGERISMVLRTILFVGVAFLSPHIAGAEEWEKVAEQDGIIVHTRNVPDSDIREFRVQMVVESTLSSLVAVISDLSSYPQWYEYIGEATVLDRIDAQEQIYYMEAIVPVLNNRDVVVTTRSSCGYETSRLSDGGSTWSSNAGGSVVRGAGACT